MLCVTCSKLALLPLNHKCVNCPRLCGYKEERWCKYCSAIKLICSVCGRKIIAETNIVKAEPKKTQIQKNHPFFGPESGGCRKCGG